jgi:DNA helicase TIP49 (TBP-interacting protein)
LCSPRARHLSGKQTDEITNAIVNMIVLDYLPLSLVEGKGFLKLMSVVVPDYKVATRNTIKSRIEKTYDEQKAVLVRNLEYVDSVSLTTDTWTSNANKVT